MLDTCIGVFIQQSFQYLPGGVAILGKIVALLDVLSTFATRERRLIEGDVADQIKSIYLFAEFFLNFLCQWLPHNTLHSQFINNSLLAFCRAPPTDKLIHG